MASLTHPTALINCCIFLFLLNKNASPILIRLLYNFVRGSFFNPANAQYAALIYEIKMHVFNTYMIFVFASSVNKKCISFSWMDSK